MMKHSDPPFSFRIRPADVFLIVFFLGASLFGFHHAKRWAHSGSFYIVEMDKKVLYRMPLQVDTLLSLPARTGTITIQSQGGKVSILKTQCPLKICQRTGWIFKPGEAIICAPNGVVITIEGGKRGRIDAVTE
jgi:hypothetical protein